MRLEDERESENVEDQRSQSRAPLMVTGGLGTLIIVVVIALLGGNPQQFLNMLAQNQNQNAPGGAPNAGGGGPNPGGGAPNAGGGPAQPQQDELKRFVSKVLAETEDVWRDLFREMGRDYQDPKLVLFTNQVESACGYGSAAMGPFYCPGDQKVYIDLTFYDELKRRFKAPGDFAQAYVIAHEIGHHVQKQLGISKKVDDARGRASKEEANQLSVRLELQADFLAGVWANHAQKMKNLLDPGDVEQALTAASAIGDDRLQMQGRGYVVPDSFTHGTSKQRVRWFMKGFQTGRVSDGDTFSVPYTAL
jgi:uncharacterized protein